MKYKRIVFTKINTAELIESETIDPNADQVMVKLKYSAISSGTERANITGEKNVSVVDNNTEAIFPRYCGYSSSGEVVAAGEKVKNVKVGDLVAVNNSTHAQYCTVGSANVHKIEFDDVSLQEASLAYISAFPMAAARKCHIEIGESAMVMGLGILGMISVKLLKNTGAYPIIAVDPVAEKREQALKFGADYAFDPFDVDFVENVKRVCGGVNVAIEATGNGPALNSALKCMAKYGRVALLGCTRNSDFTVDYYHLVHGPGISLIGAHTMARPYTESSAGMWTHHDDIMTTLKLLHGKRLTFADMIEEVHSPVDAPKVYDRLINDKNFPVVIFDWEAL